MTSEPESTVTATMAEIRQTFGRVAVTHKTHEKDAERKVRHALMLTWANLIVIAVTLGATLVGLITHGTVAQVIAIASAIVAFGFGCLQLSFQPQREASDHRRTAKALLNIRDEYGSLIAAQKDGTITTSELLQTKAMLSARLAEIFANAPQTSSRAYEKAEEVLGKNEGLTFTEAEIDRMLPAELRPSRPGAGTPVPPSAAP